LSSRACHGRVAARARKRAAAAPARSDFVENHLASAALIHDAWAMASRFAFALVCVLVPLAAGCGNDKKGAIEGLEKIKQACEANDKDLAKQITEDLRSKNKVFDKAFDAAIDDKRGSVNYCSPLLHTEVGLRIEHGS